MAWPAASTEALNCGNTLRALAITLAAMAVTVRLPPAFSTSGRNFLRTCSSWVMSALSNWVTCGIVFHACDRCSAVLRRMPDIGLRSTAPHFEKSGSATEPPDSVATLAWPPPPRLDMTCLVKVFTSSWLMRPPGPVPGTWWRSTPSSRASRRTDGAAGASGPRSAAAAAGRLAAKASTLSLRSAASSAAAATAFRLARSVGLVALARTGLERALGRDCRLRPGPGLRRPAAASAAGAARRRRGGAVDGGAGARLVDDQHRPGRA